MFAGKPVHHLTCWGYSPFLALLSRVLFTSTASRTMTIITILISVTPPTVATPMKLIMYAVSLACFLLSSLTVVSSNFEFVVLILGVESVVVTG